LCGISCDILDFRIWILDWRAVKAVFIPKSKI
jgi:hypothetical protein